MSNLLSVAEARQLILAQFNLVETTNIPLVEAVNRVLAEPISSKVDLPPFANSSMDGFAVRAADTQIAHPDQPVILKVIADVPAGQVASEKVKPGHAIRIMTGALLPEGSDAVVPVEYTDFNYRQPGLPAPEVIQVHQSVEPGENVRPKGQDVRSGEQVLAAGFRLRPQDIGFLAMLGIGYIPVYRKPRIAIFSTGDELLTVDEPLTPGKIHESNSYTITALVNKYGGESRNMGIATDDEHAVQACLDQAVAEQADLIVSSAGVSVGAFDYVRIVVERNGRLEFWRVNMRPGKPLTFGDYRGIPFIGLPGNPVSAFVGFEVFVRPALMKLAGIKDQTRSVLKVVLGETVESDGRESYLRAIVEDKEGGRITRLTGHQGSGNLRSLVQANALILIPSGVKSLPPGSEVDAWMLDGR